MRIENVNTFIKYQRMNNPVVECCLLPLSASAVLSCPAVPLPLSRGWFHMRNELHAERILSLGVWESSRPTVDMGTALSLYMYLYMWALGSDHIRRSFIKLRGLPLPTPRTREGIILHLVKDTRELGALHFWIRFPSLLLCSLLWS